MTEDNLYIKMCLALPDKFYDGWLWHKGDKFIYQDPKSKTWIEHAIGNTRVTSKTNIIFATHFYEDWLDYKIIPLPSQEQLIEMSGLDWWTFYSEIIHGLVEYEDDEQILCVCLRNVMRFKYKMSWNGEAWI